MRAYESPVRVHMPEGRASASRAAPIHQTPRGIAREAHKGGPEPQQRRKSSVGRAVAHQARAEFGKSGLRSRSTGAVGTAPNKNALVLNQTVAPSGSPTTGTSGNDCQPGMEVLNWTVVRDGTNWRADVTSMVVSGTVNVQAWPSAPTTMTTPNTANPVDGGNINNTTGSANHWQAAIDDMADYDTSGGGAGPNWHSTAASSAHEWHHWNQDYLVSSINAGNWTQANRDIDALTVPAAGIADATAARAALQTQVATRFNTFVSAVTSHWNNVIGPADVPGGGGPAYAAGAQVLAGLISAVRSYAASKGWNSTTPTTPTTPTTGTGTGTTTGTGTGTTTGTTP